MNETESRPGAVTAACWLLFIGAVLLIVAGLITGTVSFDTLRRHEPPTVADDSVTSLLWLNRGVGILFVLSGVALAWFASRALHRDPRFRRAAVALGLTIVVIVSIASAFGGFVLAPVGLVFIIIGVLLLGRPGVMDWYVGA